MKTSWFGALLLVVAFTASAATQSNTQQLRGHLVDLMCADGSGNDNANEEAGYAENHTRACNLHKGCSASGYAIITSDKTVMQLDSKGNELALELSKSSDKEKDFRVTVTGKVSGSTVEVSAITLD